MTNERFASVWDAVSASPEEAKVMRMRSELMSGIRDFVKAKNMTQGEAAKFLDLSQPRVSDLLRGKLSKFNLEMLISLSERCGQYIELTRVVAA